MLRFPCYSGDCGGHAPLWGVGASIYLAAYTPETKIEMSRFGRAVSCGPLRSLAVPCRDALP